MSYLKLPGVRLYYEVAGSGPDLLLVSGGTDDARDFAGMLPMLSDSFRVIAYDIRGNSRSRLDGPPRDVHVEQHCDDVHRLLQAVGETPAHVFGSSSGGQIGLALAATYPERVRALVAHEPPTVSLLSRFDPRRTLLHRVRDIYWQHGVAQAMQAFLAGAGVISSPLSGGDLPESAEAANQVRERLGRIADNAEYFLAHIALPAASYVPEIERLRRLELPIVVGVGDASEGQMAFDTAHALGEHLQAKVESFPGGHAGFVTHPTAFAKRLCEVLGHRGQRDRVPAVKGYVR